MDVALALIGCRKDACQQRGQPRGWGSVTSPTNRRLAGPRATGRIRKRLGQPAVRQDDERCCKRDVLFDPFTERNAGVSSSTILNGLAGHAFVSCAPVRRIDWAKFRPLRPSLAAPPRSRKRMRATRPCQRDPAETPLVPGVHRQQFADIIISVSPTSSSAIRQRIISNSPTSTSGVRHFQMQSAGTPFQRRLIGDAAGRV